jgi:diaminohydroxyphosphoribosylaminopyrimidine deaminase/5-amino-6-(5-phosphoribosylamino)uracil reductase
LAQAGPAARGGTAYVTLEPCSHHGQTPPCADALIAAGVARVVGAVIDPDPRVSGTGFERLRAACVAVAEGVCAADAQALNEGFFNRQSQGRPLIALKIAESADGFVADATGSRKWITSEAARRHGHLLRAQHEVIIVGIGTVLADDPLLTCRLPGLEQRSPIRAVLDTRLRLPVTSQLARTAQQTRVIVYTAEQSGGEELTAMGVEIMRGRLNAHGRLELDSIFEHLASMTRVLVEGGPTLQAALLSQGLADIVHVYRAPLFLGEGSRSALAALDPGNLAAVPKLKLLTRESLGPDVLESFEVTG